MKTGLIFAAGLLGMISGCSSLPEDKIEPEMTKVISAIHSGKFDEAALTLQTIHPKTHDYIFYEIPFAEPSASSKFLTLFPKAILVEYVDQIKSWKKECELRCRHRARYENANQILELAACYETVTAKVDLRSRGYIQNKKFNRSTYESDFGLNVCRKDPKQLICSPLGMTAEDILQKIYSAKVSELRNEAKVLAEKQANQTVKETQAELKRRSTPEYRKCEILADNYEAKEMLELWTKALERKDEKNDTVDVESIVPPETVQSLESSADAIKTFTNRIQLNQKNLRKLSKVRVSTEVCQQLIDGFINRNTDQYIDRE